MPQHKYGMLHTNKLLMEKTDSNHHLSIIYISNHLRRMGIQTHRKITYPNKKNKRQSTFMYYDHMLNKSKVYINSGNEYISKIFQLRHEALIAQKCFNEKDYVKSMLSICSKECRPVTFKWQNYLIRAKIDKFDKSIKTEIFDDENFLTEVDVA